MMLCDVKPMHCKAVFNSMEAHYAGSTIRQTYITIGTMFKAALINDMIITHPLEGVIEPLFRANIKFRKIVLPRCGHSPFKEEEVCESFYDLLKYIVL